jgi:hypothetical protein
VGLMERKSNRLVRFSSAAFGMVLLAGLAYYQGRSGPVPLNEESMVGTIIITTGESDTDFSGANELASDENRQISCESLTPSATASQETACTQAEQENGG